MFFLKRCQKRYCGVWRTPNWADDPKTTTQEYFSSTGRLIGAIQPFGDVWKVMLYAGINNLDNRVMMTDFGVYLTQEQAKIMVENRG